ncbi:MULTISPECIES: hypothetical protein [unclassified Mesorhizobium]|uniref:hypothetical protein n=1 Tax=unclassified Mesorhizobium TaxID=325217 RepID=UPI00112EA1BD|nr:MULTISPECIES: hypothetical protein [unclassified Mesorhizobium]MBZ9811222.1 hypothetical protein [Mesorhizobium sp. ESP-6-2]TPM25800.1 hypothetical protein FJ955_22305 [Mesorhizobium sp. B2-2-2]
MRSAVLAAAAIRSSFDLCRTILPNISELGITIGIELGPTRIARLGLVGDASVRCASKPRLIAGVPDGSPFCPRVASKAFFPVVAELGLEIPRDLTQIKATAARFDIRSPGHP